MKHESVLEGDRIRVRPLELHDVALLARWFFDPDVQRWMQWSEDPPHLRTVDAVRERYEHMAGDPAVRLWRIDLADGRPIGQIEMVDIHPLQHRAELNLCIGETAEWDRGYATEAIRLILRHAFRDLGLRRVFLITDEDNARAIRCYEKCGFVREGLLRDHRLRFGQPINMVIMGALREDRET